MKLPQLSLRDLFWLVLVCALAVGWWVRESEIAKKSELLSPPGLPPIPASFVCAECRGAIVADPPLPENIVDRQGKKTRVWTVPGTCANCSTRFLCTAKTGWLRMADEAP